MKIRKRVVVPMATRSTSSSRKGYGDVELPVMVVAKLYYSIHNIHGNLGEIVG